MNSKAPLERAGWADRPTVASGDRQEAWIRQVTRAVAFLAAVVLAGMIGFYIIHVTYTPGPATNSMLDALYLAVITLTTVGYGDNMELLSLPEPGKTIGGVFSIVYILVAYGVVVWTSSLIIAYLVEGSLSDTLFRRRHLRRIRMFDKHYILCGVGRTGAEIADEFAKTGVKLVVVDVDKAHLDEIGALSDKHIAVVEGDATGENVLDLAGIGRARGLIANLPSDPENLFLTITAKSLNPEIRIVASAAEHQNRQKLIRAGADSVVFPWQIGALRLASEMIRPTVVTFLDRMLRDPEREIRVSEVAIGSRSGLVGQTIKASAIHERTGLLVVAVHNSQDPPDRFQYNPPADFVIRDGQTVVVIGEAQQILQLEKLAQPD